MKRSEYHLNWLEAWSEKRKGSMAPKKLGAAKKPRVSTRGGSRKNGAESESGAEIVAEVREMIKEMQQVEPDITAGWCANLESTANAITDSASLSDWLGTDAAAAQMTLAAAVVDMGQRAPEGRGGLWRNWMRIFAMRVLSKFGLDKDMPEAITGLERIETPDAFAVPSGVARAYAQPPDLHTVFSTPDRLQEEMRERRYEDMMKRMDRRTEEMMALQTESAKAMLKLSGRVGELERNPKKEIDAPSGLNELERRLSEYKGAFEPARKPGAHSAGGAADATRSAPASSEPSRGRSKGEEENKQPASMSVTYQRLQHLTQNPLEVLLPLAEGFREMPAWPFAGTVAEDRVAPTYLAVVYRSGRRGVEYAESWLSAKGLTKNHMAQNMKHNLHAIDEMLMYDGFDVINSAGVEILARRCYALELVFEDCKFEHDWKVKDPKNSKAKLQVFEKYDATAMMKNSVRVPEADATVKKQLELEAQYAKYLAKAPKAQEDVA